MCSTSPDTTAITSLLRAYGAALSGGPKALPEVLSLFTSDGVLMAPHCQASVSTEALTTSYKRILTTITLDTVFATCEIEVSGKWAFARTTAKGMNTGCKREYRRSIGIKRFSCVGKWKMSGRLRDIAFSSMKSLVGWCAGMCVQHAVYKMRVCLSSCRTDQPSISSAGR